MTECNIPSHPCAKLRKNGNKGAAIIIVDNNNKVLLGFERAGQHKNTYNFFAGGMEDKDKGCYLANAYRELYEESGWELSFKDFLTIITCKSNNTLTDVHDPSLKKNVVKKDVLDASLKKDIVKTDVLDPSLKTDILDPSLKTDVLDPSLKTDVVKTDVLDPSKIDLTNTTVLQPIVNRGGANNNNYLIIPTKKGAALFVGLVKSINIDLLNANIKKRNANSSLPYNMKEMDHVKFYPFSGDKNMKLSKWATSLLITEPIIQYFVNTNKNCNNSNINSLTNQNKNQNTNKNTNTNKKNIVPNALSITINTSVPGNQIIKYSPSMTIQGSNNDTIYFDPLVSLNKSVINKIPENIRILEFFNKGLFHSLINAHGMHKEITLEEAKHNKIIDNNIQITLDTLFPTNSILYIKGEPYVIADVLWSRGQWKIDRKITDKDIKQVDVNKISNPLIYNSIIKKEIELGNEQLKQLSQKEIYGSNYDKSKDPSSIDEERKKEQEKKRKEEEEEKRKKELEEKKKKEEEEKRKKQEENNIKIAEENIEKRRRKPLQIEDQTNLKPKLQIEYQVDPILEIENNPTSTTKIIKYKPSNELEEIANIPMNSDLIPKFSSSRESTRYLRDLFKSRINYDMINMVFRFMPENLKEIVATIYRKTTSVAVKPNSANISLLAYNQTVDSLRVNSNAGGGDCLFIAVADAINYHNSNNIIDDKILYQDFGNGNNIFTVGILRTIVYEYFLNVFRDPEEYQRAIDNANINKDNLNHLFTAAMREPNFNYHSEIQNIYNSNINFLVLKPNIIDFNNERPFEIVTTPEELKAYIESSNYWADSETIVILNQRLKINIIVIKQENGKIKLHTNIKSNDYNGWNKYLFLYNFQHTHYELISFEMLSKEIVKRHGIIVGSRNVTKKTVIFNRNDNITPPLYIIFLLFSTYYIRLSDADKNLVVLFTDYLLAINNSVRQINELDNSDENKNNFINAFRDTYDYDLTIMRGGSSFKEEQYYSDNIKISFHITIDMELQKGTTLSKEQMSNIKCIKGWNKVRKSFSEFTGQKYVITPTYNNLSDTYSKKNETRKNETDIKNEKSKKNETRKNETDIKNEKKEKEKKNETRKNELDVRKNSTGGKKNKTIKIFR